MSSSNTKNQTNSNTSGPRPKSNGNALAVAYKLTLLSMLMDTDDTSEDYNGTKSSARTSVQVEVLSKPSLVLGSDQEYPNQASFLLLTKTTTQTLNLFLRVYLKTRVWRRFILHDWWTRATRHPFDGGLRTSPRWDRLLPKEELSVYAKEWWWWCRKWAAGVP